MKIDELMSYVENATAIRSINKLEPAGGVNSKIFPSTYAGGVYCKEDRLINGDKTKCVLLDSVASQANRMEEALQNAIDQNLVKLPLTVIDFSNSAELEDVDLPSNRITSLQAPHRIADAYFRECTLDKVPFRDSDVGKKIFSATARNATHMLEYCPDALLFGMWDSTGRLGGLGNKFERTIVSEIVGIHSVFGQGVGGRIDPLIQRTEGISVYVDKNGNPTTDEKDAVKDKSKPKPYGSGPKKGKVSNMNLGNVAPDIVTHSGDNRKIQNPLNDKPINESDIAANGVTVEYAEQTCVITLAGLRKLKFPDSSDNASDERNTTARAALASLGMMAFALSARGGLDLRSRCTLAYDKSPAFEIVGIPNTDKLEVSADDAIKLFNDAIKNTKDRGIPWREENLVLTPNSTLLDIIKKSNDPNNQPPRDSESAD